MTTRAGFVGLLTGLISALLIYPLEAVSLPGGRCWLWILLAPLGLAGGFLAARRSGSVSPARSAVLGGLAGAFAGTVVYSLWGAAAAGAGVPRASMQPLAFAVVLIHSTLLMFLLLFLGGAGLGALGGWLGHPHPTGAVLFDKDAPQMAMNVSITAVPASIFAAALAAAIFPRLAASLGGSSAIADEPLEICLLLVLLSHLALTLIAPHETRQAEHRCGMDEVKMAAFVAIAAAPVLILLLFLIDVAAFSNPLTLVALLASTSLSLISLRNLIKLVLPRRAAFPLPPPGAPQAEAKWFGSIANSRAPRLVQLCIGCGIVMVLPLYVTVISVLINLQVVPLPRWRLFLIQALVSLGLTAASILVLTAIYLFYLNLGRWVNRRQKSVYNEPKVR